MEKVQELEKSDSLTSFREYGHPKSITSGMTGDSHSFASEGYASERQPDSKFQWRNKWQNCMFFLGLTISWTSFTSYDRGDKVFPTRTPINFIQVVVIYVLFGCPLVFLETFLGQFAQKGCLALGNMMPIGNGLGYLILTNTFFSAVFNMHTCSILLFYVFLAFVNYPVPAWMLCLKSYYSSTPNCVGRNEIDLCIPCSSPEAATHGPCFDPKTQNLSSYLFLKKIIFKPYDQEAKILSLPDQKLALHLGLTVLILFITILKDVRDLDVPIRMWNMFTVIALTIMTLVLPFTSFRFHGILLFFDMSWSSLFDIKCWVETMKRVIVCLNLAEGGHILFGSFTPVTINTSTRSAFLCFINFSVLVLFHFFLFFLREHFLCKINASAKAISGFSATAYIFAVYPEALGTLASAPFWGSLYFLIAFGLAFQTTIMQILTIEISLTQVVLKPSYRLYTRCLTLILMSIATLLLITPQGAHAAPLFYCYLHMFSVTIVFLYMVLVFTYGSQRLYDDIHFLLKAPPSSFYRHTWFLCLVLTGMVFFIYFTNAHFSKNYVFFYFFLIAITGSLLLGFMIKFVVYLKARDLTSLLSPAETWGPADQELRMVRRLFNPRFEVRFRRQVEQCNHRCLLASSILKRTLERELALMSNVLLEIEDNEEERKLKKDLVDELRMHRTLMSRFLAERTPGEIAIIFKKHTK